MATETALNATGDPFTFEKPLAPGRAAAASSKPVTVSTEDKAVLDSLDTKLSTLAGYLDTVESLISSTNTLLTTQAGYLDGLETLITSSNTKFDTMITALQIIDNMTLAAGSALIGKVNIATSGGTVVEPAALGQAAVSAAVPTATATDDIILDALGGRQVQLVPTCDATACAQYDVLAATEVVTNAARANDKPGMLASLKLARLDATTCVDLRVWFLKANSSVGTENAAFSPADADADDLLFYVDFAAADFIGTTGMVNCFAQKHNLNYPFVPASGTRNLYVAIQVMGAAGLDLGAATDLVLTMDFIG